jgi:cytochrome c556
MMRDARGTRLGSVLGTIALLLWGCSPQETQRTAEPAGGAPGPAATATVKPAVSINAEMVAIVDHAGHVVWDAEREASAPKTPSQWTEIEHHAIQLAASGALVALGGTGPMDATWVQSPDWQKYSQNMAAAGLAILDAAQKKDQQALVMANGRLVESCEACHKQFKPDLPTEGLVHTHVE